LGVKRFFQKTLYFLCNFLLLKLIKNLPSPTCQPGPTCWAWPTYRCWPAWSNPTRWLGQNDRPLDASTFLAPLARALATAPPSPLPRSIPTASAGVSRQDGSQSVDPATTHLPVCEIWSINPLFPQLRRLQRLESWPWRPRASSRAAWPSPR
jgi:hypothetical protein